MTVMIISKKQFKINQEIKRLVKTSDRFIFWVCRAFSCTNAIVVNCNDVKKTALKFVHQRFNITCKLLALLTSWGPFLESPDD